MFEQIKGTKITGGCFEQSTTLLFFENKDDKKDNPPKIAIVYGANGSGKSSIANALLHYKNNNQNFSEVKLLDKNNKIIDTSEIKLDSLHIFNEKFINDKVRFTKDEKLNSIVLLGEMIELDDKISELEEEKSKTEIKLSDYEKKEKNLINKNNTSSYKYYENKIKEKLQKGWAERERYIKIKKGEDARNASRVDNKKVEEFISTNYDDISDEEKYKEEFDKKMAELEKAKECNPINKPVKPIEIDENLDENICKLLAEVIEKPNFSEREKNILKILEKNNRINEIKEEFNKDTDICPFCFQDIDENYKNDLLKSISNIFDTKKAQKHKLNLKKISINSIDIDLTEYQQIDDVLVKDIKNEIQEYNEYIGKIVCKINQKKTNIYIPIDDFTPDLVTKQTKINQLLNNLEKKRNQFNNNISNTEKLKEELQEINKKLAYTKLKTLGYIKQYTICKANYDNNNNSIKTTKEKINQLSKEIKELNSKKNNTELAVDIINKHLSYIFFDNNRLQIEIDHDNKYIVKVRNKSIKLKDLSEGEKNAIALCYFFSTINQNKQEKDFFIDEYFITLDDPISSFDFNNKVGIYSFLRYILNKIKINKNSRVLIFTHQIEAMFQLSSVMQDTKEKVNYLILKNHKLDNFNANTAKHHEYHKIINEIFNYAANNDNDHDNKNIGNYMRKIVESFSLFNYKSSINDFFRDDEILNIIDDGKKKELFQNLMIRLVLHGESHLEEQTKSENFFQYICPEEKKKTAKLLLVFLRLLNELHIKKHLGENRINAIDNWEKEFFTQKQISQKKELLTY